MQFFCQNWEMMKMSLSSQVLLDHFKYHIIFKAIMVLSRAIFDIFIPKWVTSLPFDIGRCGSTIIQVIITSYYVANSVPFCEISFYVLGQGINRNYIFIHAFATPTPFLAKGNEPFSGKRRRISSKPHKGVGCNSKFNYARKAACGWHTYYI